MPDKDTPAKKPYGRNTHKRFRTLKVKIEERKPSPPVHCEIEWVERKGPPILGGPVKIVYDETPKTRGFITIPIVEPTTRHIQIIRDEIKLVTGSQNRLTSLYGISSPEAIEHLAKATKALKRARASLAKAEKALATVNS